MIMMRPRGVGNRGRVVGGAPGAEPLPALQLSSIVAFARTTPARSALSLRG